MRCGLFALQSFLHLAWLVWLVWLVNTVFFALHLFLRCNFFLHLIWLVWLVCLVWLVWFELSAEALA